MKKFYLFLFIALAWTISASAQVPAFPGADGYGRYTTGGRGGEVYYVTSLEDTDTPGTLRYGVTHLSKVTDTVQGIGNHTTQQQPEYPRQ